MIAGNIGLLPAFLNYSDKNSIIHDTIVRQQGKGGRDLKQTYKQGNVQYRNNYP